MPRFIHLSLSHVIPEVKVLPIVKVQRSLRQSIVAGQR